MFGHVMCTYSCWITLYPQVRTDLYKANAGCQLRGLWEYSSWISEQLVHLPKTNKAQIPDNTWNSDYDLIMFALQLMHTQVGN